VEITGWSWSGLGGKKREKNPGTKENVIVFLSLFFPSSFWGVGCWMRRKG
jgi:hypothetical protein